MLSYITPIANFCLIATFVVIAPLRGLPHRILSLSPGIELSSVLSLSVVSQAPLFSAVVCNVVLKQG